MKKLVREYSGTRRLFQILSVFLALCLMLTTVSLQRIMAEGPEKVSKDMLIPSSVVIQEPTALSNISLPQSKYGSLAWENGSAVPNSYQGNYSVIFKSNGSADLSGISGYDAGSGTLKGTVTVVVKGLAPVSTATPTPEVTQSPETVTPSPTPDTEKDDQENTEQDKESADNSKEEEKDSADDTGKKEDVAAEDEDKEDSSESVKEDSSEDKKEEVSGDKSESQDEQTGDSEKDNSAKDDAEDSQDGDSTDKDSVKEDTQKEPSDQVDTDSEDSAQDEDKEDDSQDGDKDAQKEDPKEDTDSGDDTSINDITEEELEEAASQQPETADPEAVPQDQAQAAAQNHTCAGISVSADFLPWYVQFRVSSGSSYEFSNEEEANIFQSYEFELWDLLEDKPYEIPSGKYVTVTVPVKEGYEYTIEHLLDNGGTETIIPTVYGSTMIFSVDSFSPFGIAGSKPLVGDEIAEGGYSEATPTPTPTAKPVSSSSASRSDSSKNTGSTGSKTNTSGNTNTERSSYTGNSTSSNNSSSVERTVTYQNKTAGAVQTGDTTAILPFIIMAVVGLVVVAAIIIVVLVRNHKRRQ